MIFFILIKSPLPFVQMLSSDLSAFSLGNNWTDFVSGCGQGVIRNSFFDNELESFDINLNENSLWIFIIEFQVFVVSVKVNCKYFTSKNFAYQTIKYGIWIFYCDLKVLCLLGIVYYRKSSIAFKIKNINYKFKLLLFGRIPLEYSLLSALQYESERLSDGQIDNTSSLLQLFFNPRRQLFIETLLELRFLLDL